MSDIIKFGTDGWRGIIARDFTFNNVRRVARGVAAFICKKNNSPLSHKPLIVIGYDRRFLSDKFAYEFAKIISRHKIKTILSSDAITTPMLSYATKKLNASLGVMITASHNPPEYNGIKFKSPDGASVDNQITSSIEKLIPSQAIHHTHLTPDNITIKDLKSFYLAKLKQTFARFIYTTSSLPRHNKRIKIIFDPMHGSGAGGTLKNLLKDFENFEVIEIHSSHDPLFGGLNPEPIKINLESLSKEVIRQKASAGIAIDGDGDRIGVIDDTGRYLPPHTVFPLFLEHLISQFSRRGTSGNHPSSSCKCAVQGVAMGYLSERIARIYNIKLKEVPVGFKYLAQELLKNKNCFIGAEESGGIGFGRFLDYIPERDGLAAAMFLCGIIANSTQPLSRIVNELYRNYGASYYQRYDLHLSPDSPPPDREKIYSVIKKYFADDKDTAVSFIDGIKIRFKKNNSWLLVRPSGTEPLVRIYSEAPEPHTPHKLITKARNIISQILTLHP